MPEAASTEPLAGGRFQKFYKIANVLFLLGCLLLVLIVHGAIPFKTTPSLGAAVWAIGFSESFSQQSPLAIYATHFGNPKPAAIAFGLSGAYPASLMISCGMHAIDAYSLMVACWISVAFFGAWKFARMFGGSHATASLSAVLWLSTSCVWRHCGYAMLSLGIALIPVYLWIAIILFHQHSKSNLHRFLLAICYAATCIVAIFMDGYSFMMFAVGASILGAYLYFRVSENRGEILKFSAPVHLVGFGLAYALYTIYIGKSQWEPAALNFFRGWGLDLAYLIVPESGSHGFWDLIKFSAKRNPSDHFGDGSIRYTTFGTPIILAAILSWIFLKKPRTIATGLLIVAMFSFWMALGPSVKINSKRPPEMGPTMPAEFAICPTGNGIISQHVPGFKNMRAAYRWSALAIASSWAILVIWAGSMCRQGSNMRGMLLLVVLIVLTIPNVKSRWKQAKNFRSSILRLDNELLSPLVADIHEKEQVVFLPYRNDFLINYLAPKVGFVTYNIGGDKNLAEAKNHWPETMKQFTIGEIDAFFAERTLLLLARGEADAVVYPYVDLLWAAHTWPNPNKYEDDLTVEIDKLKTSDLVNIEQREHYAIIRWKNSADSATDKASREAKVKKWSASKTPATAPAP